MIANYGPGVNDGSDTADFSQSPDWFTENAPDPTPTNTAGLTNIQNANPTTLPIGTLLSGGVNPVDLAHAPGTGVVGPATQGGAFTGNLQDLWNQYRSANTSFHPTQGSAASLQPFVDWANQQGANIKIASPSSGGYVKGITDPSGNFIKLLDGSDNPIWQTGGDTSAGASAAGGDLYSSDGFTFPGFTPPSYTPPTPYEPFHVPTLAEAAAQPGYAFAAQEGRKALDTSAASRGVLRTGGHLKDLYAWGDQFGTQNYSNVLKQAEDVYGLNRDTWKGNADQNQNTYQNNYQNAVAAFNPTFDAAKMKFSDLFNRWNTSVNATTQLATAGANGA